MGIKVKPVFKRKSNWAGLAIGVIGVAKAAGWVTAPVATALFSLAGTLGTFFVRSAIEDAKAAGLEGER